MRSGTISAPSARAAASARRFVVLIRSSECDAESDGYVISRSRVMVVSNSLWCETHPRSEQQ